MSALSQLDPIGNPGSLYDTTRLIPEDSALVGGLLATYLDVDTRMARQSPITRLLFQSRCYGRQEGNTLKREPTWPNSTNFPEYLESTIRATTISTTYEACRIFMETRFCKLDCVPLAALACYGVSIVPFIPSGISNVTGAVLCFILTGVAGASAILPGGASGIARFAAIIACSVGTGIVGGLILNYLPSGLVQFNWVTYGFAMTLIAYAVARARGAGSPMEWKRPDFAALNLDFWGENLASACIVAAAIVISINSSNFVANAFHRSVACPGWPNTFSCGCDGRRPRYQKS